MSIFAPISLCLPLSLSLSTYASIHPSTYLSIFQIVEDLSVYLSTCLSISVCLLLSPSVRPSFSPSDGSAPAALPSLPLDLPEPQGIGKTTCFEALELFCALRSSFYSLALLWLLHNYGCFAATNRKFDFLNVWSFLAICTMRFVLCNKYAHVCFSSNRQIDK